MARLTLVLARVALQGAAGHAAALEAGRDHRDADIIAHVRIDDGAEDHVHVWVRCLADDGRGLIDLEEGHVRTASDVEEHAARTVDGDVEQCT